MLGKVLAVCISEKKGTPKNNIGSACFLPDWGIKHDAHGGKWKRQVSLLAEEQIASFRNKRMFVEYGAFGENLVIEGIDLKRLPLGTRLCCNDVVLEVTQIGKECHSQCAIRQMTGACIMPKEGVFTRVLKGGIISVGDVLSICEEG